MEEGLRGMAEEERVRMEESDGQGLNGKPMSSICCLGSFGVTSGRDLG